MLVWTSLVAACVGCAAARKPSHDEQVREQCRATATVVEKFRLATPVVFGNQALSGSAETVEIRSLNGALLGDCLRSNGVSEPEVSGELAEARRQADCRNQAMGATPSAHGQVDIVFDRTRYDSCLGGQR